MPPTAVKTIKDLIYWQYAKLISKSAGFGLGGRAFQMDRFVKLREGEINWSTSIREYIKEHEGPKKCIYCNSNEKLTLDHILPLSREGPDKPDNSVWACQNCNSSKGSKRLYEWKELKNKDSVPRIAEGKYLKLLFELHKEDGTLEAKAKELCNECDMAKLCEQEEKRGKLTVYCLEGVFNKEE